MRFGAVLLVFLCLVSAGPAAPQSADHVFRVGFLWLGSADGVTPAVIDSFRAGMRERGYVEGRNLSIVVRDGHGRVELLQGAAAELVALRVDVMITAGTAATLAAKQATTDIPIVFGGVADPVGRGVVASLSHPGANVTGLSRELGMDKAFDILREVAPGAQRVALIFHPANLPTPYLPVFMAARSAAADSLGLTLTPQPVTSTRDVDAAFATMTANRVDAALIVNDTLLFETHARLLALAASATSRLPVSPQIGQRPVACSRTANPRSTIIVASPSSSTRSSEARNPPTCRSSRERSSSW